MMASRGVSTWVVTIAAAVLTVSLTACGGEPETSSQSPGSNRSGDLTWGAGEYAVVLAHGAAFDAASWEDQATAIAAQGATVVAVEDIGSDHLAEVVADLQADDHPRVALVGASAGADSILALLSEQPDLADQIVLLSPNSPVDGLGEQPKLFVASEDEPVADVSTELADSAPGDDNEALILPGSAHAQSIFDSDQGATALAAILDRLDQR